MIHRLTENLGMLMIGVVFVAHAGLASYFVHAAHDIIAHSGLAVATVALAHR